MWRSANKRAYYDNGMTAPHLAVLKAAVTDRVLGWLIAEELDCLTDRIQ